MSKPFAVISDQHFHEWSAFATVNASGVNSRLQIQLTELRRCADTLRAAGGDTIYNAGDTFHVRNSLMPSVLNPVMDLHRELISEGFKVIVLAGNHDLASKTSNRLSSAVTSLESIGCRVVNTTERIGDVVMVPWVAEVAILKLELDAIAATMTADELKLTNLIIHAPVDGVIVGLPDHGLSGAYLKGLGFRRVFSGHYHSHKEVCDGVWSVGASCHQTWGDIGSKAGFLIVKEGEPVRWFKSHAPEFVEITAETPIDEVEMLVDGNFVRAKINSSKQVEIQELRAFLDGAGAKGVTILAHKDSSVTARVGSTVSAGASMEVSVNDFIKSKSFANHEKLALLCQDILKETESAA